MNNNLDWINQAWDKSVAKIGITAARLGTNIPYTTVNGQYVPHKRIGWWTNGFWPGILWIMYRETGKEAYMQLARGCEERLDAVLQGFNEVSHDAGFMWMLASASDYAFTGDKRARERGMVAASILAARFNLKGGFIRAWDHADKDGLGPRTGWAIIDCMMNLPLLYWASKQADDPRFGQIAMAHADTTLKHFIRDDGSVKHICRFNPDTGAYIDNLGGQGYDADSAWSRGAAWAVYGFALSARYTGEQRYLDAAKKVANFFLASLPEDNVPLADFRAPKTSNVNKDSSAAAIAAGGMILISKLVSENEKHIYRRGAIRMLRALYLTHACFDQSDEALLKNGCEAYHSKTGNNQALIYGDYFFLEDLAQLRNLDPLFVL